LIEFKQKFEDLKSKESQIIAKEIQQAQQTTYLDKRERDFKISELTYQLEATKSSKQDIFRLVETLVKNPRSIELANTSRTVPIWETYPGGGGFHSSKIETQQTSTEKSETKE